VDAVVVAEGAGVVAEPDAGRARHHCVNSSSESSPTSRTMQTSSISSTTTSSNTSHSTSSQWSPSHPNFIRDYDGQTVGLQLRWVMGLMNNPPNDGARHNPHADNTYGNCWHVPMASGDNHAKWIPEGVVFCQITQPSRSTCQRCQSIDHPTKICDASQAMVDEMRKMIGWCIIHELHLLRSHTSGTFCPSMIINYQLCQGTSLGLAYELKNNGIRLHVSIHFYSIFVLTILICVRM
jgi:hypothetical protein